MQTKFGSKLNILFDRLIDLWHGRSSQQEQSNGQTQQGQVRVSQPLSGQHQPSQADYLDNSQLLPNNRQLTSMPSTQAPQTATQQSPDFNQMYQNNTTPMVDAASPGQMQEPMAANEGGGMFRGGSAW